MTTRAGIRDKEGVSTDGNRILSHPFTLLIVLLDSCPDGFASPVRVASLGREEAPRTSVSVSAPGLFRPFPASGERTGLQAAASLPFYGTGFSVLSYCLFFSWCERLFPLHDRMRHKCRPIRVKNKDPGKRMRHRKDPSGTRFCEMHSFRSRGHHEQPGAHSPDPCLPVTSWRKGLHPYDRCPGGGRLTGKGGARFMRSVSCAHTISRGRLLSRALREDT